MKRTLEKVKKVTQQIAKGRPGHPSGAGTCPYARFGEQSGRPFGVPQESRSAADDGQMLIQKEDLQVLAEIQHVLSPYWSARFSR